MPCENLYCGALLWTQGGTGREAAGCVAYHVGMIGTIAHISESELRAMIKDSTFTHTYSQLSDVRSDELATCA